MHTSVFKLSWLPSKHFMYTIPQAFSLNMKVLNILILLGFADCSPFSLSIHESWVQHQGVNFKKTPPIKASHSQRVVNANQ